MLSLIHYVTATQEHVSVIPQPGERRLENVYPPITISLTAQTSHRSSSPLSVPLASSQHQDQT